MPTYVNIDLSIGAGGGGGGGFANPATVDLQMGAFNVTSEGGNSIWTVLPAGGSTAIQTAVDAAAAAGGGIIQLQAGDYAISAPVQLTDRTSGIIIRGVGAATRLLHDGLFSGYAIELSPPQFISAGVALNNVSAEDTTVTFTTAANAGLILADDIFVIIGTDPNGLADIEVCQAASNGVAGTGVVTLKTYIHKTLTTVTVQNTIQARGSVGNRVQDLSVVLTNAAPAGPITGALFSLFQNGGSFERIVCEGFKDTIGANTTTGVITVFDSIQFNCTDITINGAGYSGIHYSSATQCIITRVNIYKASFQNVASTQAIRFGAGYDNSVVDSSIVDPKLNGIGFASGCRRNVIEGVTINGCYQFAIDTSNGRETEIDACSFVNDRKASGGFQAGVYIPNDQQIVNDSYFENCEYGIYCVGGDNVVMDGNLFVNIASGAISVTANSNKCSVTSNIVRNTVGGNTAILLSQANDCAVVGNVVHDANAFGIQLDNSDRNIVSGNQVTGATTAAVRLTATSDDNLVDSNIAFGQTITDLGTNNTLSNNKVA